MKMPRVRVIRARLLLALSTGLLADGIGGVDVAAQAGTLHAQLGRLDKAAWTYTLGVRYTKPIGEGGVLPAPGQRIERDVRPWLLTATAGGGLSRTRGSDPQNELTLVGQLGVLYRTGSMVEQVGLVAYGNLEPGLVGPALAARVAVVELIAGAGWLDGDSGVAWFAGAAVALELWGDLAR
jgi:hypothetical protein